MKNLWRLLLCLTLCAVLTLCMPVSPAETVVESEEIAEDERWFLESALEQGQWARYPLRKDLMEGDYEDLYVFDLGDNVYAFFEGMQVEEVISYLIIGEDRALMWDTGLGIFDMRGMAEKITELPLTVLVSHTHFDHIGGMAAFDRIMCYNDPDVIAALEKGLSHESFEEMEVIEGYLGALPSGLDPETIYTPGQTPAWVVENGDIIDLGGRPLEVMYTPGHSGHDIMLLDASHHILFTADMYYPGPIIIETIAEESVKNYCEIMKKVLARVEELGITRIFGGHNCVEETPEGLRRFTAFAEDVANGRVEYTEIEEYGIPLRSYEYPPDPTWSLWVVAE